MTRDPHFDLKLRVKRGTAAELSLEERREVAAWIEAHRSEVPEPVRIFPELHLRYLGTDGDVRRPFNSTLQELRRLMGIIPSSEKRPSGNPLAGLPRDVSGSTKTERERLEARIGRTSRLCDWHQDLNRRHGQKLERLHHKAAKLSMAGAAEGVGSETEGTDEAVDDMKQGESKPGTRQRV